MAHYLGYEFIDSATVIFFDKDGNFDAEKTDKVLSKKLEKTPKAVIPGFYGSNPDGSVRVTKTTVVTGKGQQYFINKFLGGESH